MVFLRRIESGRCMVPCNTAVAFKLELVMWNVDSTIHDKDLVLRFYQQHFGFENI